MEGFFFKRLVGKRIDLEIRGGITDEGFKLSLRDK